MNLRSAFWIGLCAFFLRPLPCSALGLSAATGFIQLPATTYHYLGYDLQAAIGSGVQQFTFDFGLSHPYLGDGFSQAIYFSSVGLEWTINQDHFVKPFFGVGLGIYADSVSSAIGVVPSLIFQGGVKLGGSHFGALLETSSYLGVYAPSQLLYFTAWPLINFMGGIYVDL